MSNSFRSGVMRSAAWATRSISIRSTDRSKSDAPHEAGADRYTTIDHRVATSAMGHKPTMQLEFAMSAIPPNPDIADPFTRARPFKAGAGCNGRKIGSPKRGAHIRAWSPRQASQSAAKRRAAPAISGACDFLTFH